jgi:hypothetical protein
VAPLPEAPPPHPAEIETTRASERIDKDSLPGIFLPSLILYQLQKLL